MTPDIGAGLLVQDIGEAARVLCLNRPAQANALDAEMIEALTREVSAAYADEVRLLVLRGEGKHFCAGLHRDPDARPDTAGRIATAVRIEALLQLLWNAPFVTVAVVEGAAIGAGAEIAVTCDYRIAGPAARFQFPGFRLMGATLGTRRFAEVVGASRAFDIVLNNRRLEGDAALAAGLATHALDGAGIQALIDELEQSLAEVDKGSIALMRDALRAGGAAGMDLSRVAASLSGGKPACGWVTRRVRS